MIECLQVRVGGVAGRADAADGVLNSVSPVNTSRPVDDQREHPAGVARGVERRDGQAADLQLVAGLEVAGGAVDELALGGVDQHLRVREAVEHRGELGDVVVVVVGEQHVGDGDALRLGLVEQRAHGAARVDEEAVAAGAGGDEVGVRQPVRVHRALDDHGADSSG